MCVRGVSDLAFTLFLGRAVNSLEEIQWETLLPSDGTTGWLLDHGKQIEIHPKWAVNPPALKPDGTSGSDGPAIS